jgi:protein required for attachment to host cells
MLWQTKECHVIRSWIVVANRIEARIFRRRPFTLLHEFHDGLGREKNRAMTTDKPGMGRASFSQSSPHTMTGEKNPHDDAAVQFARKICHFLKHKKDFQTYDDLEIYAEPRMMGFIRENMDKQVKLITQWLPKDFAYFSNHEVAKALGVNDRLQV